MFDGACEQNVTYATELSEEECSSIATYKEYQTKHLPCVNALKDLYAVDYDPEAYPAGDLIDGLKKYLDKLKMYTRHVKRAAYLRQAHYDQYILGLRPEEPGHTAWLEGMNSIAEDCAEKLEYWSRVYNENLTDLFTKYTVRKVRDIDLTVRNCDLSFYTNTESKVQKKQKQSKVQKIYRPPKISARERARINERYRAQLLAKSREEHKMLDVGVGEASAYHQLVASYDVHKVSSAVEVPIRDIYDTMLRKGIDAPLTCQDFMLDFNCGIILVIDLRNRSV